MSKKQQVTELSPVRVAVSGARGKMGQITVSAINNEPDLTLVASIERSDDIKAVLHQASPDVLIDFTLPDCVFYHSQLAIELGIRPVVGASGLSMKEIEQFECTFPFYRMRIDAYEGRIKRYVNVEDSNAVSL